MSDIPVIIQNPVMVLADVDNPTVPIDVSCDVSTADLTPEQDVTEVIRFCGTVQAPGALVESCSLDLVVNVGTFARWAPLVGKSVKVNIWDGPASEESTEFVTYIGFNPGLYGTWTPGEARTLTGVTLPVMGGMTQAAGVPPAGAVTADAAA